MGIAWPQRKNKQPISMIRWLWLALLERNQSSAANEDTSVIGNCSARGSNATLFEAFFLRYDRQITGYLWRMTGNEQIASDLAQETFLRAWQHFDSISHYDKPLSWLFRVATNLARQHHRQSASMDISILLTDENDPSSSDPTAHIIEQDLIRQTLIKLPFHQRAALVLREVYGLSCVEIGNLLNISRDAVKMSLWRAREQFRTRYLQEEENA
jgi:RNA polymerase sigma-70 factor (ECF subfamily)